MVADDRDRYWLSELLMSVQAAPPVQSVAVLARILREQLSALDVAFLINDLGGNAVVRLTGAPDERGTEEPERLPLAGSVYEKVIVSQQPWVGSPADAPQATADAEAPVTEGHTKVIAPVSDRGDPIGLLEVTLPRPPSHRTLELLAEAAHAFAYVVIVNRRFTDFYEWGRRTTPLSLASEIQHRLLPDSFTCDAGPYVVAGSLEPAANVGGDTFDYTLNSTGLFMSLTDAMGHDVRAAQLASVVVGAMRNARRAGLGLVEQADAANMAVVEHAVQEHRVVMDESAQVRRALAEHGAPAMVTGQLLTVDFETGDTAFINAGHVWPLRLREGRVEEITPAVDLPFGISPESTYRVQNIDLRPGDRLVLITDGMLEPEGEHDRLLRLIEQTRAMHPREAVRAFTQSVLDRTDHDPRDDATVLCLEWSRPAWPGRDS
ncbi:PP2C family protein-serine/threonine phosphatase [Streptomyces winkii]|uniref:PP2C family protein-serine/threonine phosphatase n=1 Tax=Streptomyces winkii TaxID=3051178 RepID=UPI0028D90855|nr:PP2C family protein-serine/threonine phosphatase [Streptomyces sp. DSM 40971]